MTFSITLNKTVVVLVHEKDATEGNIFVHSISDSQASIYLENFSGTLKLGRKFDDNFNHDQNSSAPIQDSSHEEEQIYSKQSECEYKCSNNVTNEYENSQTLESSEDRQQKLGVKYPEFNTNIKKTKKLLEICSKPDFQISKLKDYIKSIEVKTRTSLGKNFLHVLANNKALIEKTSRKDLLNSLDQQLMNDPASFCAMNERNLIPFTDPLVDWIQKCFVHTRDIDLRKSFLQSASMEQKICVAPVKVELSSHITSSFEILSSISQKLQEPMHRSWNSRNYHHLIIEHVSQIPLLLKTVLYIDDDTVRSDIFDLPILQHCLLRKEAVSTWIIAMLAGGGADASRAINYFEYLSNATLQYTIHPKKIALKMKECHSQRESVIEHLAYHKGLLPALVALDYAEKNRATSTYVVRRILDHAIFNAASISAISLELFLDILLNISFHVQYTIMMLWRLHPGNVKLVECIPWVMILWICSYFFLVNEVFAFFTFHSWRAYFLHYYSFTNVVNFLAILGAIFSTVWFSLMKETTFPAIHAIVMGLIWIKLFCYLIRINHNLATFTNTLGIIISESFWLLLFLFMTCFVFADLTFIIVTSEKTSFCKGVDPSSQLDTKGDICSNSNMRRMLRAFATFAGDLALDDYRENPYLIVLWVTFTFFGIIVLLNVLIGIVADAYQKSSQDSRQTTGRARLPMLAKHESFRNSIQRLLRNRYCGLFQLKRALLSICLLIYLAILHFGIYILGISTLDSPTGAPLVHRPITIVFFVGICVVIIDAAFFIQFCHIFEFNYLISCFQGSKVRGFNEHSNLVHKFFNYIFRKMLGIKSFDDDADDVYFDDSLINAEYIISRVQESFRQEVKG